MANVNTEMLIGKLKEVFDIPELKDKFSNLEGFKFNPFKFDPTGKPEGWDVFVQDGQLVVDVFLQVIKTVEKVTFEAGEMAKGKDKLDAVCEFLDDVVSLPFYLEWVDGPAIKMIVTFLVNQLNKLFGNDWINHIPVPE